MSSPREGIATSVARLKSIDITSKITDKEDRSSLLNTLTTIRKAVSASDSPPISDVLDHNPLPTFIAILEESSITGDISLEVLWILTNIAAGPHTQTAEVVDSGALDASLRFLEHPDIKVAEQVLWLIGNVSADSVEYRDVLLNAGTGKRLLTAYRQVLANEADCKSFTANVSWLCSNLLKCKPFPSLSLVAPLADLALDILKNAPATTDLSDVFWAFSYMTELIFFATKLSKIPTFLTALRDRGLLSNVLTVQSPALRIVGNIVMFDNRLTQVIVDAGFIPVLAKMYQNVTKSSIRREVLWTLSNITAGSIAQAQAVFDCAAAKAVMLEGISDDINIAKEAAFALCNPLSNATSLSGAYDTKTLTAIMDFLVKEKAPTSLQNYIIGSIVAYLRDLLHYKGSEGALRAAVGVDWMAFLQSPLLKEDPNCFDLTSTISAIMMKSDDDSGEQWEPAFDDFGDTNDADNGQLEPVDVACRDIDE